MHRFLFGFLILALLAIGEGCSHNDEPRHPHDPDATLIASFYDTVFIASPNLNDSIPNSDQTIAVTNIFVFRNSGGRVDYRIDADSVRFEGDPATIVSCSTIEVFEKLARNAVRKGVEMGLAGCPQNCQVSDTNFVFTTSCVRRIGSGINTHFVKCSGSGYCPRKYAVCCPSGLGPSLTSIPQPGPSCAGLEGGDGSSTCEPTCP